MTWRLKAAPRFQADVEACGDASRAEFGAAAADRYAMLLDAAVTRLRDVPFGLGTRSRPELSVPNVRSLHLRHCRGLLPAESRVRRPRHAIFYRADEEHRAVILLRLLHDAMDPASHL